MHHKLSGFNLEQRTAICSVCGPTQFRDKGKGKGRVCISKLRERSRRYGASEKGRMARRLGAMRHYEKHGPAKSPWRKFVKPVCERCGYKAVDMVLMDGHHRDHNRNNNTEENIESLCAFCHRLVHRGLEHLISPMDTSSFDKKMEEYRKLAKAGVPFPYDEGKPDSLTKEAHKNENPTQDSQGEVDELKAALEERGRQIKALLEDNDRLSKEVAAMENRLQRVARLTDNEKLILWIRKYDDLKKVYDLRVGGSEFSQ